MISITNDRLSLAECRSTISRVDVFPTQLKMLTISCGDRIGKGVTVDQARNGSSPGALLEK
jgi:hypothetical protein